MNLYPLKVRRHQVMFGYAEVDLIEKCTTSYPPSERGLDIWIVRYGDWAWQ